MDRITTAAGDLERQAPVRVSHYLGVAISAIDEQFGEIGYAKRHPDLVATFIKTAATDYATLAFTNAMEELGRSFENAAHTVSEVLSDS